MEDARLDKTMAGHAAALKARLKNRGEKETMQRDVEEVTHRLVFLANGALERKAERIVKEEALPEDSDGDLAAKKDRVWREHQARLLRLGDDMLRAYYMTF